MNRYVEIFIVLVLLIAPLLRAADLYSSGTKTWDTSTANWGNAPGVYNGSTWNNATPDSAFLEGSGGTVTLLEDIDIQNLSLRDLTSVNKYTIRGNTLHFAGGGTISAASDGSGSHYTDMAYIESAVTGAPAVDLGGMASNRQLAFNPTNGTVTLGAVTGSGVISLGGSTTGNSLASSTTVKTRWNGSGEWTLTGLAAAYEHFINSGNLIIEGSIQANSTRVYLNGGVLHYNNPGAVTGSKPLWFNGGALDNTSGSAITNSTGNPPFEWNADWTFIGSQGAASDLNLGTGTVTMNATRTVTVSNAATTLTIGGVIGDGGNVHGLIKAGAGTLKLTGISTYTGDTIINDGTNIITQPYLSDIASVWVTNGAVLKLDFTGTNDVFDFYTNGVAVPKGTVWGAGDTPLLAGSGYLRVVNPNYLDGVRYWDGGTTDDPSNGDAISDGGDGTWDTSTKNWDGGAGVPHTNWNNSASNDLAYFRGAPGTITVTEEISLGAIFIDDVNYTIQGGTLTFPSDGSGTITNYNSVNQNYVNTSTIKSGISGEPSIVLDMAGNMMMTFAPTNNTMELGAVTGGGMIVLGGTSGTNSLASQSGKLRMNGENTWIVSGDVNGYQHWVDSGTLVVNGLLRASNVAGVALAGGTVVVNGTKTGEDFAISGGTVSGTGTIYDDDVMIPAAATIAPGWPTGTLTITNNPCTIEGTMAVTVDGNQHSTLAVDGTLTLTNATLHINEANSPARDFVIATYTNLIGTFTNITGATNYEIDYIYQGRNEIALLPPPKGTLLIIR
jgi:autotransporter-associated beta strand protein